MSKNKERDKDTKPATDDGQQQPLPDDPLLTFALAVQIVGMAWRRMRTSGPTRSFRLSEWLAALRAVASEKAAERAEREAKIQADHEARVKANEANRRSEPTPAA